jgi:hypothetical protein
VCIEGDQVVVRGIVSWIDILETWRPTTGLAFNGGDRHDPNACGRTDLPTGWRLGERQADDVGAALFVTVLGLNFLGDAVCDSLDPKLRVDRRDHTSPSDPFPLPPSPDAECPEDEARPLADE